MPGSARVSWDTRVGETGLLFYYTDAAGLLGIVQEADLWAVDAEFLNDAQELRYGRADLHQALLDAADLAASRDGPGGPQTSRAQIMRSAASQIDPDGFTLQPASHAVYVVCFCEAADVLSQWRGYAEGGGYALGFDQGSLAQLSAGEDTTPIVLRPVRYGPAAIGPMVDAVLDAVAPRPTGHLGVTGFWAAGRVVLPMLAQVKHEAFSEEREWRLITTSDSSRDLLFHIGPRWPVPLGTALGVGILIDATFVRALFVPALVSLFGRWNWWLLSGLAKVLRVEPSPVAAAGTEPGLPERQLTPA